MANPRKFIEKIALHNHRQAEETARFEAIMQEVSVVTSQVDRNSSSSSSSSSKRNNNNKNNTLRINTNLGSFRGGSLPNVSAGLDNATRTTSNQPSTTTTTPTDADTAIKSLISADEQNSSSSIAIKDENGASAAAAAAPPPPVNYRSGARSPGGPIRRPHDRRFDTSPYSSTAFLSPPHDLGRRTHSDGALHQSAMQGMNADRMDAGGHHHHHHNMHHMHNRGGWMMPNGDQMNEGRPRSSCEVPRVPGIHIHPSAHVPGSVQIPISGNNTGSLPDLTNVQNYSSPLQPLDPDLDQGSSPYSSSPVNTSPSTLSPTSIQGVRSGGGSRFFQPSIHLLVPNCNRYTHNSSKNIPIDNKNMQGMGDGSEYTQLNAFAGMYQHPPTSPSPTLHQQGYRSPRPSPQSSPGLGGRHSAPCSPGAPSPQLNDYATIQFGHPEPFQQQLQQFQQLTVDWAQLVASLMESGCTWSAQLQSDSPVSTMSYVDQSSGGGQMTNHTTNHSQNLPEVSTVGSIEPTSDLGYYSTSPSQMPYPPSSLQTTPNTPTSIPNIILTDFSNEDQARQEMNKLEDDFFSEEAMFRQNFEPLDFADIQLLTEPDLNLSDNIEDNFRS